MTLMLFLLFAAIVAYHGLNWWERRRYAAEMVAALEAAKMHQHPVLVRSQFIGDTDVEARAADLRERLRVSGNQYLSAADVRVEIYHSRAMTGRAYISFFDWAVMVEFQHAEHVGEWMQARRTGANGRKFTQEAEKSYSGQRDEKAYTSDYGRVFEWDKVNYKRK